MDSDLLSKTSCCVGHFYKRVLQHIYKTSTQPSLIFSCEVLALYSFLLLPLLLWRSLNIQIRKCRHANLQNFARPSGRWCNRHDRQKVVKPFKVRYQRQAYRILSAKVVVMRFALTLVQMCHCSQPLTHQFYIVFYLKLLVLVFPKLEKINEKSNDMLLKIFFPIFCYLGIESKRPHVLEPQCLQIIDQGTTPAVQWFDSWHTVEVIMSSNPYANVVPTTIVHPSMVGVLETSLYGYSKRPSER